MSKINPTLREIKKTLETVTEKYKDIYKDMIFFGETKAQLYKNERKELRDLCQSEIEECINKYFNQEDEKLCLREGYKVCFNPTSELWNELYKINWHKANLINKPLFEIVLLTKTEGKKGNYSSRLKIVGIRLFDNADKEWLDVPWDEFAAKREKEICNKLTAEIHKELEYEVQNYTKDVEYYSRKLAESKKNLASFEEKFI